MKKCSVCLIAAGFLMLGRGFLKTYRSLQAAGLIALASGAALLAVLMVLEERQMKKLAREMNAFASGQYQGKKRPHYLNAGMGMMWNGFENCVRGMERIQYQQKMYSRFIPKAVGVLFQRQSVESLFPGKSVFGRGLLGFIFIKPYPGGDKRERMAVKNQISDIFLKLQEEGQAVYIPKSGDLQEMWGIFPKGIQSAVYASVQLCSAMEEKHSGCDVMILLHQSDYSYGLTGSQEQILPCFSVAESDELSYYAGKLQELHVKAAVIGQMAEKLESSLSLRHIGMIEISGENRNLYEILEAYPVFRRRSIEKQTGKFRRALELYYANDFYLARNLFVEVLRECPQDEVAKWYLFACENRLGSVTSTEAGYGLFAEI